MDKIVKKIRPSRLDLVACCPMTALAPEDAGGKDATRGTYLHGLLPFDIELDKIADLTVEEITLIEDSRTELLKVASQETWIFPTEQYKAELEGIDISGTPDAVAIDDDTVYIADLKTGRNLVSTKRNWQLMSYCYCAIKKFGYYKKYKMAIIQPHVQKTEWVDLHLTQFMQEFSSLAFHINTNVFASYAGYHCESKYCSLKDTCSSYRYMMQWKERSAIEKINSFLTLPKDEQVEIANRAKDAIKPLEKIVEMAKEQALKGEYQDIETVEVKTVQGNRKISSAEECFNLVNNIITQEEFVELCTIPVTKLVDVLTSKLSNEYKTKKSAKEEAEKLIESVVEREKDKIIVNFKNKG